MCEDSIIPPFTAVTAGTALTTRTIGAATGFGATEKCTWVVKVAIGAPTFLVT